MWNWDTIPGVLALQSERGWQRRMHSAGVMNLSFLWSTWWSSISHSCLQWFAFCFCVCFSRQGSSVQSWLRRDFLCRPGWLWSQRSACLWLLGTRIKDVCHLAHSRIRARKQQGRRKHDSCHGLPSASQQIRSILGLLVLCSDFHLHKYKTQNKRE